MAVAFRQSATASGATSVSKPTGTVNGDVIILVSNFYDSASATMTWPSGFTQIALQRETGAAGHEIGLACAWKIASSEGASYTITNSASAFQDLIALSYSGPDGTTPIDTSSSTSHAANIAAGYTATWTGVTAARNSSIAIALFGGYDKDCTTPSGYTARVNALDSAVDASELAVNAGSVSGPTGTVAVDGGGGNNGSALILVIIQPPSSGSAPSSSGGPSVAATGAALFAAAAASAAGPSVDATSAALKASVPATAAGPDVAATGASLSQSASSSAAGPDVSATSAALKAVAPSSAAGPAVAATSAALKAAAPSSAAGPSVAATGTSTGGSTRTVYLRDDFSGSSVDSTTWAVWNRVGDLLNSEIGCYVTGQVTVTGGNLVLTSEVHTQSCGDSENSPASHNYRSGGVAQKLAPFLYGTITFRAQMPSPRGCWPAIWMLGYAYQPSHALLSPGTANPPEQNWPNPPWDEIDLLEVFSPTTSGTVYQIIHSSSDLGGTVALGFDPTAAMHTYEITWSPGQMVWKVDGSTTKTITNAGVPSTPMFLIMNTAIGGTGGGTPTDADFPGSMLVDFIQVESDTASPSSAAGPAVTAVGASLASGAPSSAAGPGVAAAGASLFGGAPSSAAGPNVAATGTSAGAAGPTCAAGPSVGGIGASRAAAAPSCTISPNIRATSTAPVTDNPFQGFAIL